MNDDALRVAGFQFAPQASAVVDLEQGRILGVNRALCVLLGYSEEELIDQPFDQLASTDDRQAFRDAVQATRSSPLLGYETCLPLRREDGSDLRVRLKSRLIDEGMGAPIRAVVTVDELCGDENEAPPEAPASSDDQDRDAFFAMLAHELRNRLSNFRLAVQILRREDAAPDSRWGWGLSVIDQQVIELAQMTDDMLDASRLMRGGLKPQQAPLDLVPLVETAVAQRQNASNRRTHIDLKVPPRPVAVLGDPPRLQQIVSLLLNVAYMPDVERLGVALTVDGEQACLTVRGPGLQPQLFTEHLDMFAAATQAANHRPGLGLEPLLASGLIARMQGRLVVQTGVAEARWALIDAARLTEPAATPDARDNTARRVLVVDDDPGAANTLVMLLSNADLTVEVAHDGQRALASAERRPAASRIARFATTRYGRLRPGAGAANPLRRGDQAYRSHRIRRSRRPRAGRSGGLRPSCR